MDRAQLQGLDSGSANERDVRAAFALPDTIIAKVRKTLAD
jgi:hypothetical protein